MNSRQRFIHACQGNVLERPPVWVMRQAGRYLPEYRALKEKYSFLEMVKSPELACEVTLQPLKRYPLDAAILFSDILVIPEALGQPYMFRDGGGIEMAFTLNSAEDIDRLAVEQVEPHLSYVADAMRLTRSTLGETTALLGFGGSPWTLATYMVEGGSSRSHEKIKHLAYTQPSLFATLMQKLCDALIGYFKMQIAAGADALQIFDSFGHLCPAEDYYELSLRWIRQIVDALAGTVPLILYSKGMGHLGTALTASGAQVYSVDWTVSLPVFKQSLGNAYAVQGNLDPALLSTTPALVREKTLQLLDRMAGHAGFIFNLGHGILPTADPACMETLVNTVCEYGSAKS